MSAIPKHVLSGGSGQTLSAKKTLYACDCIQRQLNGISGCCKLQTGRRIQAFHKDRPLIPSVCPQTTNDVTGAYACVHCSTIRKSATRQHCLSLPVPPCAVLLRAGLLERSDEENEDDEAEAAAATAAAFFLAQGDRQGKKLLTCCTKQKGLRRLLFVRSCFVHMAQP